MATIFLLNPSRRPNKGTSAGASKGWVKRARKYGASGGDRPAVRTAHKAGVTVKSLKSMTLAQRKKHVSLSVLKGLGLATAGKKKRKPAKKTRKNAFWGHEEEHSKAAKKKWRYKKTGQSPPITLYDLIGDLGVMGGQAAYKGVSAAGRSYSSPRSKKEVWNGEKEKGSSSQSGRPKDQAPGKAANECCTEGCGHPSAQLGKA